MEIYLLPAITARIGLWRMVPRKQGEMNGAGIRLPVLPAIELFITNLTLSSLRAIMISNQGYPVLEVSLPGGVL